VRHIVICKVQSNSQSDTVSANIYGEVTVACAQVTACATVFVSCDM